MERAGLCFSCRIRATNMDACLCFLFLPIVFIMRFIVTRQLNKMIRQLEEEVEQKGAPVILYDVNEGK